MFWQGGIHNGCISIPTDYEEAYKTVVRHVVREHGAKDTFFLAGIRDEANSRLRLRYWQEVMEEEGLPCEEEQIAYGNYLESEARFITENMVTKRDRMPPGNLLCQRWHGGRRLRYAGEAWDPCA